MKIVHLRVKFLQVQFRIMIGTIVSTFFGRLVQREMDFADGSALDVARYYTLQADQSKSYSDGNEEYFKESESRFEKASYMKR
jgi:carboxyl-terminal processing protease